MPFPRPALQQLRDRVAAAASVFGKSDHVHNVSGATTEASIMHPFIVETIIIKL